MSKPKFASAEDELKYVADELFKELDGVHASSLEDGNRLRREAVMRALHRAADVGHRTTTTDDWMHLWD